MKHRILLFCLLPLLAACAHKGTSSVDAQPTAFGSALVEVAGSNCHRSAVRLTSRWSCR
jgi:hypothetical protein